MSALRAKRANRPPRNIGFRGRHDHGKPLDDPVYPTKSVPQSLKPQFPVDWRNGGRAILTSAMSIVERKKRVQTFREIMDYQSKTGPFCHESCGSACLQSMDRYLCAARVPGTILEQVNRFDGILRRWRGNKPD